MDTAGTGLILILNGLLHLMSQIASWPTLLAAATLLGLLWIAKLEVAEVDRSAAKPQVVRH